MSLHVQFPRLTVYEFCQIPAHRLFVEGTRAMLTSGSLLHHASTIHTDIYLVKLWYLELKSHKVITSQLDSSSGDHECLHIIHQYTSFRSFFKNKIHLSLCAVQPDSEVAQAGRNLEVFFFNKLREIFPERTFPSANQETTDRARLRWLGRKRKETHRRKRLVFSGKKYYL